MKRTLGIIIYLLLIANTMIFISFCSVLKDSKKILEKLEDLNNTLQYIDARMDTLEFFRVPDRKHAK